MGLALPEYPSDLIRSFRIILAVCRARRKTGRSRHTYLHIRMVSVIEGLLLVALPRSAISAREEQFIFCAL